MTRKEQAAGKIGEKIVQSQLIARGFLMVEKIGTPIRRIPLPEYAYKMLEKARIRMVRQIARIIYGESVSGDHRALLPGGKSVLIESKTVDADRLIYSKLRDHQPEKLSEHAEAGGVSLLAWVTFAGVFIMRWPVPGFKPRTSIDLEKAQRYNIQDIRELKELGGDK